MYIRPSDYEQLSITCELKDMRCLQTSDTLSLQVEVFRIEWQGPIGGTESGVVRVGFGLIVAEIWIVERKV
jgi:hypothetical protein